MSPAFKITPAGSFDPDEQRVLSPTEYLKRFGHQLAESRGRRLSFIDAELIDDDRHRRAVDVHPLTELLERARLSGANAAPIFSRASSVDYTAAVSRFVQRDSNALLCFRIGLQELEDIPNASVLSDYVRELGGSPGQTVLLLDGGPLQIDDAEDLAHLLAMQMARLIVRGTWLRVFWSATSFPDKPKMKPGTLARFPRSDWHVYEAILRIKDEFPVVPMFSDYMLEFPGNYLPLNVSPTAKLFYSTENEYIYCKGRSTRVGDGYGNILSVAAQLVSIEEMKVSDYSLGDSYIHGLAGGIGKTGNASMWRWCSTDHHLAMVDEQLTRLLGIPRERLVPSIPAEQLQLV
ncbi:beta family protein [Novosphingobium rhizosphaerae]|uniref:beta family protein n=1 Tax=Novosphingobium rhizosphaerae TaxID=1551649 RepID=UPI003D818E33